MLKVFQQFDLTIHVLCDIGGLEGLRELFYRHRLVTNLISSGAWDGEFG